MIDPTYLERFEIPNFAQKIEALAKKKTADLQAIREGFTITEVIALLGKEDRFSESPVNPDELVAHCPICEVERMETLTVRPQTNRFSCKTRDCKTAGSVIDLVVTLHGGQKACAFRDAAAFLHILLHEMGKESTETLIPESEEPEEDEPSALTRQIEAAGNVTRFPGTRPEKQMERPGELHAFLLHVRDDLEDTIGFSDRNTEKCTRRLESALLGIENIIQGVEQRMKDGKL